ncbi:MAG TPA: hypothetical protein VNN79_16785, partial [Actinomycetota bacterium]|nr:hypothetical protein [Actinomycetota bacterium]
DDDLREALEGMAGEASPPPMAPQGVLASARRRVARNSAGLLVALVVVAGGVAAGVELTNGSDRTPIPVGSSETPSPGESSGPTSSATNAPPTTVPATSAPGTGSPATSNPVPAPSLGQWSGPSDTMVFVDGVIYRFVAGSTQPAVVGIVPDDTALQPPVRTPSGVVVLGGAGGRDSRLWLIPAEGGAAELLASRVDGFAVSADGSRIAYSELDVDPGISVLWEGPLAAIRNVRSGANIDADVRIVGFAGTDVVVATGDGAAASAALWTPGQTSVQKLHGYGDAIATDPASGFTVLTEGDGRCWVIARLGPTGNAGGNGPPKRGDGCGIAQAAFEPGGDAVAGVILTSEDRSGPQRFLLEGTTSQLGGETVVDGAFQTWWKGTEGGAPTILVLSEPQPNTVTVVRCVESEQLCSSDPVWTATGTGDPGTAWIVEERPAA